MLNARFVGCNSSGSLKIRTRRSNSTENMRSLLVKKLRHQRLVLISKDDLFAAITDACYILPENYNRNLYLSMSKRVAKVVEANGAKH